MLCAAVGTGRAAGQLASSLVANGRGVDSGQAAGQRRGSQHYYDIVEPAAALEALEVELGRLIAESGGGGDGQQGDDTIACHAVCTLIKQECDAEVLPSHLHNRRIYACAQTNAYR